MTGSDLALRLWMALATAHALVEAAARRDASRHGLTLSEFDALDVLHREGPMHLGTLGRAILVSSGGTTYIVDRLEDRSLVERTPCERDRRAVRVRLTPRGASLMATGAPEHAAVIRAALACLDEPTQRATLRALRRVVRSADDPVADR